MITIQETKSRELTSPEEIVGYLQQRYAEVKPSEFAPGEAVDITARAGIPPEFAVGDVAVFLCSVPNQPFSYILALNSTGREIAIQVQTSNLNRRAAS